MKKFALIAVICLSVALVAGCASFQQNSYQTLGAIATTVEVARAGFVSYANNCACITSNQLDQVQQVYSEYQTAMAAAQVAEAAAIASNNANDPAYLTALKAVSASAADVAMLVAQITAKK
jgi:hypothetical protein